MLNIGSDTKIYLCSGSTDMRKGINGLSILAQSILSEGACSGAMFVFRGKRSDRLKLLWWDGQGFCLFYKCLDSGKFIWPKSDDKESIGVTRGQLSMLMEGIDWRNPKWSSPPIYTG
ncbi:IS66 family insertion sequence element accessory protein TnpB [Rickettsiaceae bacterium]|jgi:transposase|nr:IS66 family insertion sequence element accessory protein TnpB [Rickettsiaceae bacterium]